MEDIYIEKKANAYTVEIQFDYKSDKENEVYFYKTREEMEADLSNIVERAHQVHTEIEKPTLLG